MSAIEVRTAHLGDAAKACETVRRCIRELCVLDHNNDEAVLEAWLSNKRPDRFEQIMQSERSYSVVAVDGDHVRGFAQFNDSGEIGLLYVDPGARFQGVSRAMLRALEQKATSLGLERLNVSSTKTAVRFYEAAGYRKMGNFQVGFAGLEAWAMEKDLIAGDRAPSAAV